MPLHGKIVVIKRSGGDGTEFPLTASCLFGRKADCDIRIQLPQVSKEHCRIDLNENKEVILTNLSSVNPTRVNGDALQQSERLKHGDLITIIDRSFRFEYPPAPTPKKRSSAVNKSETLQVLQDQQVREISTVSTEENKKSDLTSDFCLKDGTNIVKLQQSDKSSELESKEDGIVDKNNPSSPFCELYEMVKQSFDSKTPRKTSGSRPQTPASRFCTPKSVSTRKVEKLAIPTNVEKTPKTSEVGERIESEMTVKSFEKESLPVQTAEMNVEAPSEIKPVEDATLATPIRETPKRRRRSSLPRKSTAVQSNTTPVTRPTPQKLTAGEVAESLTMKKTPTRRRSKESDARAEEPQLPTDSVISTDDQTKVAVGSRPSTPKTEPPCSPRISPRTAQKKLQAQDVLQELEKTTAPVSSRKRSGDVNLSVPKGKRKRVSFGGNLSPELFDKRLPPNSPLQKGSTPLRRSLCVPQKKQSLLRRASVIGLIKEHPIPESCKPKGSPGSKASPKRPASSSKTPSPAKKSPKAKTPSPAKARSPSPAKKSPKAKTPSPAKAKTPSPGKTKSPKIKTKTPTPEKRQTKSSPGKKSPSKDVPLTPKAQKSPKTVTTTSKSPLSSSANQTPTVKGRFSISRISTPSPTAERGPVSRTSVTATPGATPRVRRKSMKSVKKSAAKGALAVMRNRRSGVSRASMKVVGSWADIVKFGHTKSQTVAPTKKTTIKGIKTKKVVVPKPKTPARKLKEHASTGHADSPMTIVVGRAHKMKVVEPTAGAPKLVPNMALLRKNMKMDEDLTGVAEIFTTPACPRQRKSVAKAQQSDIKTPQRNQSLIETSVMNTPEETGEMVVSPLSVASTAKRGKYNTDAVSRLFQDNQDSSFIIKDSAHQEAEVGSDTDHAIDKLSEDSQQEMSTPKQKPEQPDCLTGVKRIMRTPKQKMEPVEDLRGKLLKTPRAPKLFEEVEFDGMTELLETPKQKGEPSDDLPGLKEATETPLVESTPSLCATVIQRVMKTPKEKAAPVEDMIGVKRLMQTPKVKGVPVVDMVGVKRIMKTPKQKSESVENNFGIDRLMKSPMQKNCAGVEDFEGLQELVHEPVQDESIAPDVATEQPEVCLDYTESGSEDAMRTVSPIEADEPSQLEVTEENNLEPGEQDVVGEEQTENAPALSEDMVTVSGTDDDVDLPQLEVAEEKDLATEEPHRVCEEHTEDLSCPTPSDDMQTVSQTETVEPPQQEVTKDTDLATEEPHVVCKAQTEDVPAPAEDIQVSQTVAVEPPELDVTEEKVEASTDTSTPPKTTECITEETAQDPQPMANEEHDTELTGEVSSAAPEVPVRGRRGKKTDLAVQTPVRQSKRSRVTAQIDLTNHTEAPVEVSAPVEKPLPEPPASKPKRGRKTKQPSVDEAETVHGEAETVRENTAESANDAVPETEMADGQNPTSDVVSVKQRGGRKTKQSATKTAEVVSVARAKRGRMVQKESVENEPEVVAIPQNESVETSAPVEKPRRGRKVKQDSVEQAEESAVEPPVTEKEEAQVPVSKPKRGRRTKPDAVEPVEEPSAESTTADALVCQDPTIMAAKNPKRGGRRPKQNAVEQVDEPSVESDGADHGVQEETTIAPEKPKRGGRKTKQNPEVEATPAPTNDIPVEKPKRGRRTKQDVQAEKEMVEAEGEVPATVAEAQEEAKVPRPKPARGRRAAAVAKDEVVQEAPVKRGRRGASVSRVEATNAVAAVPVTKLATRGKAGKVNKDVTDVPAEVQPEPVLRGKRGAKSAKVAADETTVALITEVIPVEEDVAVTKEEVKKGKGRFSRKGKADSETVIDRADDTENIPESDVNETMSSKKSVNWKAQLEVTHEFQNGTPVPVKASRGRRAKTNTEEASAAETTALKAGNKRKMVRGVSKAEEADPLEAVPAEPVKRPRRGAKSTYAAPLADITSASVDVTDASSEAPKVIESAKGRGKALGKGKALSADIEQTEEVQETKPRRGRAGKK